MLQVFYPCLSDTVEVLQVNRVLERMNTFLRLMHEGLSVPKGDLRAVDVSKELLTTRRTVAAITDTLKTAFPIPEWARTGKPRGLAVAPTAAENAIARFQSLGGLRVLGVPVRWEGKVSDDRLLGTATIPGGRIQPFALLLKSDGTNLVVHCISPVGRVGAAEQVEDVSRLAAGHAAWIGAILTEDVSQYDLTVEDEVELTAARHDVERVGLLLTRVVVEADAVECWHFGEVDQPLTTFETDLRREGSHGRD